MSSLRKEVLVMSPEAGANIDDCILEAITLAVESFCKVQFTHNGRTFTADIRPLFNLVLSSAYPETKKTGRADSVQLA